MIFTCSCTKTIKAILNGSKKVATYSHMSDGVKVQNNEMLRQQIEH